MNIRLLLTTVVLSASVALAVNAQTAGKGTQGLGWDLSYDSLLLRNSVSANDPIRAWLQTHPSSVEVELAKWPKRSVTAAMLLEKPTFQGQQRETMWLVRTRSKATFKVFLDGKLLKESPVPLDYFDNLFTKVSSLQQGAPLDSAKTPRGGISGYCGFLSLYGGQGSRQMLLTMEDFYSDDQLKRGNIETELAGGRLAKLLESLFKIRG